ncbi:MAG: hypothetical protein NTZ26_08230 [Candidatus Aminicenantes bacterium]|nr:hypothetical protein [Candidatus Aminicenantes bacterium]
MMPNAKITAVCLAAAVLFVPACRGKDPVAPARKALAGYVAAVDAFAARAEKVTDPTAAAAAVETLVAELQPVAAAIRSLGAEFPGLGDPAAAPERLKPDAAAADEAGGRLAAAMTKIMAWGDAPAVRTAVAKLAKIENLLK